MTIGIRDGKLTAAQAVNRYAQVARQHEPNPGWDARASELKRRAEGEAYHADLKAGRILEARDWLTATVDGKQDFDTSNMKGKLGEWARVGHRRAQGFHPDELPKYGYDTRRDLQFTLQGATVTEEVKTDFTHYPNVFVEVSEHQKPDEPGERRSGVRSTEADLYVTYFAHDDVFFVAPSVKLCAWLTDHRHELRLACNSNGSRKTYGYLVPKSRWTEIPGAGVAPRLIAPVGSHTG